MFDAYIMTGHEPVNQGPFTVPHQTMTDKRSSLGQMACVYYKEDREHSAIRRGQGTMIGPERIG